MKNSNLNKIIDPGQLDEQIKIYRPTELRTASGGVQDTLQLFATVRAKVQFRQGAEGLEEMKLTFRKSVNFYFRFCRGLDACMVIEWEGQKYDIEDISYLGRRRFHVVKGVLRQ